MARRVVLEWTEEVARVWWKFGQGSGAPFPGMRRAWFAFLREWVWDALESVTHVVLGRRDESARTPLPTWVRVVVLALPPRPHARRTHVLHGAGSILAPPARIRGDWRCAALST